MKKLLPLILLSNVALSDAARQELPLCNAVVENIEKLFHNWTYIGGTRGKINSFVFRLHKDPWIDTYMQFVFAEEAVILEKIREPGPSLCCENYFPWVIVEGATCLSGVDTLWVVKRNYTKEAGL